MRAAALHASKPSLKPLDFAPVILEIAIDAIHLVERTLARGMGPKAISALVIGAVCVVKGALASVTEPILRVDVLLEGALELVRLIRGTRTKTATVRVFAHQTPVRIAAFLRNSLRKSRTGKGHQENGDEQKTNSPHELSQNAEINGRHRGLHTAPKGQSEKREPSSLVFVTCNRAGNAQSRHGNADHWVCTCA